MKVSEVPGTGAGNPDAGKLERDIFMDALRVLSLAVVVAFHWIALIPHWTGGRYADKTVISTVQGLWPLTWILDTLPIFLFVGGFANATSYRRGCGRGEGWMQFVNRRLRRLLIPTFVLLGVWEGFVLLGDLIGGPLRFIGLLVNVHNTAPFGQLWFVGVYLLQICLVPLTLRAHERYGVRAIVIMVGAVAITDFTAWTTLSTLPLVLNFVLVWMVPHQLGYFYADCRLQALRRRSLFWLSVAGLLTLALVTSLPQYSRDFLEPKTRIFQMSTTPTSSLVAQAFWIVPIVMVFREPLGNWLAQRKIQRIVAGINGRIMEIFLWHTTAYLLAVLLLQPVGGVWSLNASSEWWAGRPIVIAFSAVFLGLLLWMFRRFGRWRDSRRLHVQSSNRNGWDHGLQ